ncbi:MAG: alpha/beta hydrolase [Kiritimatiellae bacterium]|nr:alpha/beta hydrolase [Kiritimatiellia bacterium]
MRIRLLCSLFLLTGVHTGHAISNTVISLAQNTIHWPTETGVYYSVEWTSSLADTSSWKASWYDQTAVFATSEVLSVDLPLFYRINASTQPYIDSPVVQDTFFRQMDVELRSETNWWNAVATLSDYQTWHTQAIEQLQTGGTETNLPGFGTVRYLYLGTGSVILISHGGLMGYDNAWMLTNLMAGGHALLCPSRPGYPGTPLLPATNDTFELAADMMAALLDALHITNQVFVFGTSAGGPTALQFALRHPEKSRGLLLFDAVSMPYEPNLADDNNFIVPLIVPESFQDQKSWKLLQGTARYPEELCYQWLQLVTLTNAATQRELAAQLMAVPEYRDQLMTFTRTITPISQRYDGTINDDTILFTLPTYPLGDITIPVFVSHSLYDGDVPVANAYNVLDHVSGPTSNCFFYGAGHLFFLGGDWTNITHQAIEFMNDCP